MGLNMYLNKRTYVQNWDHLPAEERHTITITGPRAADIRTDRITEIVEQVAYWRKANAIHGWFVRNCQDGVDDCRDAYVSIDTLQALRDLCRELLTLRETSPAEAAARAQCANVLPPTPGFFFGSTELDEYYWEDVAETERVLTTVLAEDTGWSSYYYHSSW